MGSTRVARQAGSNTAVIATPSMIESGAANERGSPGFTSKRRLERKRDNASAAGMPSATPANATTAPSARIMSNT
jgi:hypothetical protein